MTHQSESQDPATTNLTRREAMGRFALYGTVMSILQGRAAAQRGASGSYTSGGISLPQQASSPRSDDDLEKAVKIMRAMRSGPSETTREATVAELDHLYVAIRLAPNSFVAVLSEHQRLAVL